MALARRQRAASKRLPRRLMTLSAIPSMLVLLAIRHYFVSFSLPSTLTARDQTNEIKADDTISELADLDIGQHISRPLKVAVLTAYPPEWHGIGEWVYDHVNRGLKRYCEKLAAGNMRPKLCPMEFGIFAQDSGKGFNRYPAEVQFVIRQGQLDDYLRAADYINAQYDVLSIQHEFGMFGGPYIDDFLFAFWDKIRIPVNINFHTVLGWGSKVPNIEFRLHVREVLRRADHVTNFMPQLCAFQHSHEPRLPCSHVPHGYEAEIPSSTQVDEPHRHILRGRRIILSLGFITPDKGFHFMLRAMPRVIQESPSAIYVVVGGYAPGYSGDYLEMMQQETRALNLTNHVLFATGGNLAKWEVLEWFSLAEIVVAPHTWRHQISSGTVTMAMGYGKAAVAAAFPYVQSYMCDPKLPPMDAAIFVRGNATQQVPRPREVQGLDLSQALPCWTVPYEAGGAPSQVALGQVVSALLVQPALLEGTKQLALDKVKGTTFEELAERYAAIYRHMVAAADRWEAGWSRRAKEDHASATSASWAWSSAGEQRQVAAVAAALRPLTLAMVESPRQRPRTPRKWAQGVTLEHLGEALQMRGRLGQAGGRGAVQLPVGQVVDAITGLFSRGPLLFSRWIGRPPGAAAPPLVEVTPEGHAVVDNGLLAVHGDLSSAKLMHTVLEEGFVLGFGPYYQVALAYTVRGQRFHADLDSAQGVRWGSSATQVWCEMDLVARGRRVVGTLRTTYSAAPGSPVLTCRYDVRAGEDEQLSELELSSKVHYGQGAPLHDSFHAFRRLSRNEAFFQLAPVVTASDVIFERKAGSRQYDWDVVTDRNGEYPVFTFSPDMDKLRYVSHHSRHNSATLLHVAHRYSLGTLRRAASQAVTEMRVVLSRADIRELPRYGFLFDLPAELLGFDLSTPRHSSKILEIVRLHAASEDDAGRKRALQMWLQHHWHASNSEPSAP